MKITILIFTIICFNFASAEQVSANKDHKNISQVLTESDVDYFEQCSNMNYIYINMDSSIEIIPSKPEVPNLLIVTKVKTDIPENKSTLQDLSSSNDQLQNERSPASIAAEALFNDQSLDISQYLPEENDDYLLTSDQFDNQKIEQEFEKEISQEVIDLDTNQTTYFN